MMHLSGSNPPAKNHSHYDRRLVLCLPRSTIDHLKEYRKLGSLASRVPSDENVNSSRIHGLERLISRSVAKALHDQHTVKFQSAEGELL